MVEFIGRKVEKHDRSEWTQERIDLVTLRWKEGVSASIIGQEMGISRNAVIGKIHRLVNARKNGVEARATTSRLKSEYSSRGGRKTKKTLDFRKRPQPKSATLKIEPRVFVSRDKLVLTWQDDSPTLVSLFKAEKHHCRWPIGKDDFKGCCGAHSVPGLPYCEAHSRRAFATTIPAATAPAKQMEGVA